MGLLGNAIVMVQHFPATGDYIVHREGATVEVYHGDDEIADDRINRFIRECLTDKLYHESTVHLATGRVKGPSTTPVKQIIYCKSFDATNGPNGNGGNATAINWVLWVPSRYELTINRGMVGLRKVVRLRDLADAPPEVRDFMEGCTDGVHVALSHHYSEPDRSSGTLKMVNISEYFFSTGKIIYGFQREHVAPITPAEMESIGLKHM